MRRLPFLALLAAALVACDSSPRSSEPFRFLEPFGGAPLGAPAAPSPRGDVWVASADGEAIRIAAASGRVVTRVRVGRFPLDIAIGHRSIWVPSRDEGTVTRIDDRTNRVTATIAVGSRPTMIASGEGGVWVLDNLDHTLTLIDPSTNRVARTVPVPDDSWDVAAGAGAVWVAGPGAVTRFDPETMAETASYRQESFRGFLPHIAIGDGSVWVTDTSTSLLWRIDPRTDGFDYREVPTSYPSNRAVAVAAEGVWIVTLSDVVRLDSSTERVAVRAEVGGSHIAIGADAVWIGDEGSGTLFKLDRSTGRIIQRVALDDVHAIAIG